MVIATKVFGETGTKNTNSRGLSRVHIMDGVKASLKRLQVDHIDLYQVHGFDVVTPIEETLSALDNLVRHGHVRYVGVSNWAAWQIMKAIAFPSGMGWRDSNHCRRITRLPAAIWSASWFRCCEARM